jgi:hypothetical protein
MKVAVRTPESPHTYTFPHLHTDTARNSSDDFNRVHDKNKWQRMRGNPFGGPIVVGFQLEYPVKDRMRRYRRQLRWRSKLRNIVDRIKAWTQPTCRVERKSDPYSRDRRPRRPDRDK